MLEIAPQSPEAVFLAAVCELERGRPGTALPGLEHAAQASPGRADYVAQLARALALLGQHEAALRAVHAAEAALAVGKGTGFDALTHDTLGAVLTRLGRFTAAARHFESAAALAPNHAELQYHLGNGLVVCGELERAASAFERALELDPDHARAHMGLADLLEGPAPPGRIEALEAALGRAAGSARRELVLSQALARTLEAGGRTAEAFALWSRSKAARKAALGYAIDQDKRIFAAFERLFAEPSAADERPGADSTAPIFVVGMPRTGTTLVERILASHSTVRSGGELIYFPQSVREAGGGTGTRLIDLAAAEAAHEADPAAIGRRYLELSRIAVGEAERFTDKLPLNFLFVGFIRRALPRARIVCLRRGALDTCLASFRQLFAVNFPWYRYALSPLDTAEYVALYERLMALWVKRFPEHIHTVQYESLVSDIEGETRRLLDFAGLPFEAAVLDFDRNAEPVGTASAAQVRRPVHARSVGAWRRYEKELEPVRRRLEALGIEPELPG